MTRQSMETLASPDETDRQLHKQLDEVVDRLLRDHPTVDADAVRQRAQQERDQFSEAKVHIYVPILVERAMREWLAA